MKSKDNELLTEPVNFTNYNISGKLLKVNILKNKYVLF